MHARFATHTRELKRTLLLAAPITAGHFSQMILGFVDTVMIGRVGVVPLAASAFANVLLHFVFIIGVGLLSSVSVLVAHAHGSGNFREAGEVCRRGCILGVLAGILMFLAIWFSIPYLGLLGQPQQVVAEARGYLLLVGCSMPFMMGVINLRNFSEAQDIPWPAFWAGLAGVLINVALNWVFIYGNLGAPRLGLDGAGLATFLSRVISVVLLACWLGMDKRFSEVWPRHWFAPIPSKKFIDMLRLGFPVSLQLAMEVGAFGAATLIVGLLGIVEIAAHQIALTCAATTFMFPLGLSLAVAIRVGQSMGAGRPDRARSITFGALFFAVCMASFFAILFIFLNQEIALIFTADMVTINLAGGLIIIAGLFQLFDGIQVVSMGALRGCKDVVKPTWIAFLAYWIMAIPFGAFLCLKTELEAKGVWIGLALGLGCAAVGLSYRFIDLTRRTQSARGGT